MTPSAPQPDELGPADADLLERYLDGQLSGDRLAQAEDRIAQVPAMRLAVEQQERIDGSLKRQFQAPAVSDAFLQTLLAAADDTSEAADEAPYKTPPPAADSQRQRRTQLLAIATTLACVMVWGLFGWEGLKRVLQPNRGYAQLTVAQVYQGALQDGFRPDWLCEDDQEFAQTFYERQGQGLLLEPLPEGVRMAGLAYLEGLTNQATSMMAYVNDQPVLVMVGRKKLVSSHLLEPVPAQGIAVFKREIGDLIAVEVTPLDGPHVLDYLTVAEVPAEPTGHVPGAPKP